MLKIIAIQNIHQYNVTLLFNNGVAKEINLLDVIQNAPPSVNKNELLKPQVFSALQIGEFGQLYWKNVAMMKDENNNLIPCEYDISAEYAYFDIKN
jgi:hypothetical protein